MRRVNRQVLLVLALAAGGAARADEPPKPSPAPPPPAAPAAPPPKPPTYAQAADEALAAVKGKDDTALGAAAARNDPDPWLVADELIRRGESDAADAFARAASRAQVDRLPAYVASRRGKTDDPARRARVDAANAAIPAGKPADALEALGAEEPGPIEDVVGVRLAMCRGAALVRTGRFVDSSQSYRRAGEAAETLGWWGRAGWALWESAQSASRGAPSAVAQDAWTRAKAHFDRHGDGGNAAGCLLNLGNAYESGGDHANALVALEQALSQLEALGDRADRRNVVVCLVSTGMVLRQQRKYAEARSSLERGLAVAEAIGDRPDGANALNGLGLVYSDTGDAGRALETFERAQAWYEALGAKDGVAGCLVNVGGILAARGDRAAALARYERGFALAEESGQRFFAVNALVGLGTVYRDLGDAAKAMPVFEDLLARRRALGDEVGVAKALMHLGSVHLMRGEHAAAAAKFEAALAKVESTGDTTEKGRILNELGIAYLGLGEYAKALAFGEQALSLFEADGDRAAAAGALVNLGSVYVGLADFASARAYLERGRALAEEIGHRQWAANALGNLGRVYGALGETPKALETWRAALAQHEALGDRSGVTAALSNIGLAETAMGDVPSALATFAKVLAEEEAQGAKARVATTHACLGGAYARLGDLAKARASFETAKRMAKSLRLSPLLASTLEDLASLYLRAGQSTRALGAAVEALRELESMMSGLGEEQGARAREHFAELFALGTVAAVREEDVAEALTFLESGRAGALLDALGSRDLSRWKAATFSGDLRAADERARAAERSARRTYEAVLSSGQESRASIRAAATALDEALDDVRAVNDRVERQGRRGAGLYYPRPKALEDIQAALSGDETLVLYGLCLDEALALVVGPAEARVVALGPRRPVEDACAALDVSDPTVDVAPALATLRRTLVEPLALGKDVRRVVVSPEGPLGYLPFGALFDRPVAMTPSGTTLVLLHDDDRGAGQEVLALGDPDYAAASDGARKLYFRGRPLSPLPSTREEAEAIGSTRLLGAAASEGGLRSALATHARWRAVHLACHGLLDPERPTLSSLALSRAGEDDGFLTALEVLRMEIPSDLVVLSACETGKGRIVGGEGIVGLTRAFMYAGSPRVICSLWKVDDEATRALMTRFYELWNPKGGSKPLGTAEALRAAQEFVRAQERWKHPYYWAAWVLWGLPS